MTTGPATSPRAALWLILLFIWPNVAQGEGRHWAFLIGVNRYSHPKMTPLSAGPRSAYQMYNVLIRRCGFEPRHVVLMMDDHDEKSRQPWKFNIEAELDGMLARVRSEDTVLVYFTGHGFRDRDGHGYLATFDTDPAELSKTAIPIRDVVHRLSGMSAYNRLLILDCCLVPADRKSDVSATELPALTEPKGVITITSCSPGEGSFEDREGDLGIFTRAFVDALQDRSLDPEGKGGVGLYELFQQTSRIVIDQSNRQYRTLQRPRMLYGPESADDRRNFNVSTFGADPWLVVYDEGERITRRLKVKKTVSYEGDNPKTVTLIQKDQRQMKVLKTVPDGRGRPESLQVFFAEHEKSIDGDKPRWAPATSKGALHKKLITYHIDSTGPIAEVSDAPKGWKLPARGELHPLLVDECILPSPQLPNASERRRGRRVATIDPERILEMIRHLDPHCEPVFIDGPTVEFQGQLAADTLAESEQRDSEQTVTTAIVSVKIGQRGQMMRLRFYCELLVDYSLKASRVRSAQLVAQSEPARFAGQELRVTINAELENEW